MGELIRLPLCEWCKARPVARRGQKYCSAAHKQRAYEWRQQVDQILTAVDRANRHLTTLALMLRTTLASRHLVRPPIQGGPENAQ